MKAVIETETKRWLVCPECGGRVGTIDHLKIGSSAGPWPCKNCGVAWYLDEVSENGVELRKTSDGKRWVPVTVTLTLRSQTEPITFKLHAHAWEPIEERSAAYFYNEHTCPTNWMRDVVEIRIGEGDRKNRDPHGLFEFTDIKAGHGAFDENTGQLKEE